MTSPLRLLAVFAHPDDESLGMGGALAKYAVEGVETHLLTATRGQRGWYGSDETHPGLEVLGRQREAELRCAAEVLGLRSVHVLDYLDGDLDQARPAEVIAHIAAAIRRLRPQVVVTFGPEGAYGHPDHIAISQSCAAAILQAAAAGGDGAPFRVSKLYYMIFSRAFVDFYTRAAGETISMTVDGIERTHPGWDDWAITTRVDAGDCWETARQAIRCHVSQAPGYTAIINLPEAQQRLVWSNSDFYRVFSLVNGGSQRETDLFAGLR